MKYPKEILDLLDVIPSGMRNPKKSKQISMELGHKGGITNEQTRFLIKDAINLYGIPIGSCSNGYFIITNSYELDETVRDLENRKSGIIRRLINIKKGCAQVGIKETMTLFGCDNHYVDVRDYE